MSTQEEAGYTAGPFRPRGEECPPQGQAGRWSLAATGPLSVRPLGGPCPFPHHPTHSLWDSREWNEGWDLGHLAKCFTAWGITGDLGLVASQELCGINQFTLGIYVPELRKALGRPGT